MIFIKYMNISFKIKEICHNNAIPVWLKPSKDDGSMPIKFIKLRYKVLDKYNGEAAVTIKSKDDPKINKRLFKQNSVFYIQGICVTAERYRRRNIINGINRRGKSTKTLKELAHGE